MPLSSLSSGYLFGCVLLGLTFLGMFLKRKDLQQEMLVGGMLFLPFAFTAPFYIPEYWKPPYFFGLAAPFLPGLEDFLFCFFVGGISSTIYEFLNNRRERSLPLKKRRVDLTPYFMILGLVMGGELFFPKASILILGVTGVIVGTFMIMKRHDLTNQSFLAGGYFTVLYFVLFYGFKLLYPSYIDLIYQHANMLKVYVLGIPLEELLFAFSAGMGWSITYEYMFGYVTQKKTQYARRSPRKKSLKSK